MVSGGSYMMEILYMRRCFQLARLAIGHTHKNPLVGSVIVHQHRIIGEGYHHAYGEDHGEIQAIKAVSEKDRPLIPDSTLYVNLEPCSHYGKTPPCADEIIKQKIKKVVIGCLDPNPKVNGQGIKRLQAHGVVVEISPLQEEARLLNKVFFKNISTAKPYVILKYANSQDLYIGNEKGQVQISNKWSRYLVHKIRHQVDAILIGSNTAVIDNPRLTNRLYYGKNPIRVVLDKSGKIPADHHLLSDQHPTWLVSDNTTRSYPHHVRLISWPENLDHLLTGLYGAGIGSLMVEGGARTLQSFIDHQLWDELWRTTGNTKLDAGIKAPNFEGTRISSLLIDQDLLEVYSPIQYHQVS